MVYAGALPALAQYVPFHFSCITPQYNTQHITSATSTSNVPETCSTASRFTTIRLPRNVSEVYSRTAAQTPQTYPPTVRCTTLRPCRHQFRTNEASPTQHRRSNQCITWSWSLHMSTLNSPPRCTSLTRHHHFTYLSRR